MKTLQLRFAAILVSAVVCVVLLATAAMIVFSILDETRRMVGPMSTLLRSIDISATANPGDDVSDVVSRLGPLRRDLTDDLQADLLASNAELNVSVYDRLDDGPPVAVMEMDGRPIVVEFPTIKMPPLDVWTGLASWIGLVAIGVIGVALAMSYRLTQPFAVLEKAVSSVRSDGVLPHIPEVGTSEARETAAVLNRLSDRLRKAMESRMRLVAAAGHDLRTPMTRMRIRSEFLTDSEREDWLRDIDELERIADSAIRLVREEAGGGDELVEVDLGELLTDTVEDLQTLGHRITLIASAPVTREMPFWAMKRALRNLLINAATHGRGGRAALTLAGSKTVITIVDDGPGIPEDLLERVFEPFFRAEPGRLQTIPGAGLGMAIAQEIIERSGGKLSVANGPAGGLIQTIVFGPR